jgi:hypothetical protein
MRILVATSETQGERDGDYCWTVEGELVRLPGLTCPDPGCGCTRGWAGLASSRSTTTCKVVERDLDSSELLTTFTDAFARGGWLVAGDDTSWIADFVGYHRRVAETFPVDTVLGIDNDNVINRSHAR